MSISSQNFTNLSQKLKIEWNLEYGIVGRCGVFSDNSQASVMIRTILYMKLKPMLVDFEYTVRFVYYYYFV